MDFVAGQMVFSKCGHDKGSLLVVISAEGDFIYVADGKRRRVEKPKRKKTKHIQGTNYVDTALNEKLMQGSTVFNADIVRALKEYISKKA